MIDLTPIYSPSIPRDDFLLLIADAVRLHLPGLPRDQALAIADTIPRSFKAAGLSVRFAGG